MFNSNIWPGSAALRDISFQNLNNLDINLSRSLRSNVITQMDSPYAFLLISYLISALLQDTKLRNLSDLDFDLLRSLKVKCDGVIGHSIYGFLLIYISNCMSISHRLAVTALEMFSPLIIRLKLRKIKSAPNDLKMTLNAAKTNVPYTLKHYL